MKVKYNNWTILKEMPSENNKKMVWCQCKCGKEFNVVLSNLKNGTSKRCRYCKSDKSKKNQYKKPIGMANANHIFLSYKLHAKRRNLEFKLSFEDFLKFTKDKCHYCGRLEISEIDLKWCNGDKKGQSRCNGSYKYNGIDRIDSDKGYNKENCVTCCGQCNWAKSDSKYEDFINWIKCLINYNMEKLYGKGAHSRD